LFGDVVGEDGAFKEGWTQQLADKFPRLANTAQRYKTEGDFLQGIDNALGLIGKKQTGASYPKADSAPEDIAAFREAAGVPSDPAEYQLKPETLPDGLAWDEATGAKFAELMHQHHIPAAAAKALVAAHLETVAAQQQGATQQITGQLGELVQKTTAEMRKEWGAGFQDRLDANNDFIAARLGPDELANPAIQMALSHPSIVRLVDEARRASREAPLPGANASTAVGSMSPRQQGLEIMKANPNWRSNPELARRVSDLYAQDAAAQKRRG
jgi:hypothetical protein